VDETGDQKPLLVRRWFASAPRLASEAYFIIFAPGTLCRARWRGSIRRWSGYRRERTTTI